MMYAELYQYLLQHKQLQVPGIGTFLLERKAAEIDFPNKQILPPYYTVAMQAAGTKPPKRFFTWLGHALNITDRDAVMRFNDFAFDLKKQIGEGDSINWNGVGQLSKGLGGDIKFLPSGIVSHELPVHAEKVIRENAAHMVRVGEDHKTSAEMVEMLNQPGEKRSYWWAYAIAIGLLAIMFIGWYFSEHGVAISTTANSAALIPLEPPTSTYQLIP